MHAFIPPQTGTCQNEESVMQCTTCSGETKVVSTAHVRTDLTKRRRECLRCGVRITSHERPEKTPEEDRQVLEAARREREAARRKVDEILLKLNQVARCLEEME